MQIYVGSILIQNYTLSDQSSSSRKLLASPETKSVVSFAAPSFNTTGYVNVSLINSDGGVKTFNGFYYTSDCPYEGIIGVPVISVSTNYINLSDRYVICCIILVVIT